MNDHVPTRVHGADEGGLKKKRTGCKQGVVGLLTERQEPLRMT
jgi:hypothetical protein